jgi:FkbM family methyltransferase
MLLSWRPVVKLRNVARSVGLTRLIARLGYSARYEERFGRALIGSIRPGDVVWDVGANIGFYAAQFAERVGPSGTVVAFEPVPQCFRELSRAVAGASNVRLVNAGLGSVSGTVRFDVGDGSVHQNARVLEGSAAPGTTVLELPIYSGDEAAASQALPHPTLAKVDVEGFELDVLRGMSGLLRSERCHDVFVELHFGVLAKRGQPGAPDEIVRLLRDLGYTVKWVDPSHVHATRGA